MRRRSAAVLALSLSLTSLHAQTVTSSAVMGAATATAQAGTNPAQVRTLTNAPLPASATAVQALGGVAVATLTGRLQPEDTRITLNMQSSTIVNGVATASVDADALLTITLSSPVPVRVELTSFSTVANGAPVPIIGADLDNNGTLELSGRINTTVSRSLVLSGTTTMRLHLELANDGATAGTVSTTVQLAVIPDHPSIGVQTILNECTELQLSADETFAPTLRLRTVYTPVPNELTALVFGFTPQFTPLPFGTNCFLLPATDVVQFGFGSRTPLDLPAILGPISFYAQYVLFSPNPIGPRSSRGIFITL